MCQKSFYAKKEINIACSQLCPLPLAIRKEICVLIRPPFPHTPPPPAPGLFARFHQEKYSGPVAFKEVYDFSNPTLELFDPRMRNRKPKPFRKTNCFEDF